MRASRRQRHSPWFGSACGLLVCLLTTSCASVHVAPVAQANFAPETDEAALWTQSAALEKALAQHSLLYEDPPLLTYLNDVAGRVVTPMAGPDVKVRVFVVKDPFLNAFALPNGSIYLHTGLLASMDNEAQLATVMGHEVAHFVMRHSLRAQRTKQNQQTATRVVVGILAVAAAGLSGNVSVAQAILEKSSELSDVLVESQVNGYSRDLEREADEQGLQAMAVAGYDPHEGPRVFEKLLEAEQEAGVAEPYYLGSHPRVEERLASYREVTAGVSSSPSAQSASHPYDDAIAGLLLENAILELRLGRPGRARACVDRHLTHQPNSARGYFALGEVHRHSDTREDAAAALSAYQRAATVDPSFAPAWRELGLLHRDQGNTAQARAELSRYIELAPDAVERPILEAYLRELPESQGPRGGE